MKKAWMLSVILALSLVLAACGGKPEAKEEEDEHEATYGFTEYIIDSNEGGERRLSQKFEANRYFRRNSWYNSNGDEYYRDIEYYDADSGKCVKEESLYGPSGLYTLEEYDSLERVVRQSRKVVDTIDDGKSGSLDFPDEFYAGAASEFSDYACFFNNEFDLSCYDTDYRELHSEVTYMGDDPSDKVKTVVTVDEDGNTVGKLTRSADGIIQEADISPDRKHRYTEFYDKSTGRTSWYYYDFEDEWSERYMVLPRYFGEKKYDSDGRCSYWSCLAYSLSPEEGEYVPNKIKELQVYPEGAGGCRAICHRWEGLIEYGVPQDKVVDNYDVHHYDSQDRLMMTEYGCLDDNGEWYAGIICAYEYDQEGYRYTTAETSGPGNDYTITSMEEHRDDIMTSRYKLINGEMVNTISQTIEAIPSVEGKVLILTKTTYDEFGNIVSTTKEFSVDVNYDGLLKNYSKHDSDLYDNRVVYKRITLAGGISETELEGEFYDDGRLRQTVERGSSRLSGAGGNRVLTVTYDEKGRVISDKYEYLNGQTMETVREFWEK